MSKNKQHELKKTEEAIAREPADAAAGEENPSQDIQPQNTQSQDAQSQDIQPQNTQSQDTRSQDAQSQDSSIESSLSPEDSLEQHYMRFGQRLKYKRRQYKKKTEDMSFGEHIKFFLYYYKWNVIIVTALVACGVILGKEIYTNSRPMALGLAILNNEASEDENLPELIEEDYRSYYEVKSSDRFIILDQLAIDPETYTSEIMSTLSSSLTSYESLYYQTTAGNIDVIITDEKGLLYCIEQDLVYPIENFFDADVSDLIEQDVRAYTSYTGEERRYAVDISQSSFARELNLGYDDIYLLFPNNTADSISRAARFIRYIYDN